MGERPLESTTILQNESISILLRIANSIIESTYKLLNMKILMFCIFLVVVDITTTSACTCNAGTGTTCKADISSSTDGKNYVTLFCKVNGVVEGYTASTGNGCKHCTALRSFCATTCNYCA